MTLLIYGIRNAGPEIKMIAEQINTVEKRWENIVFVDDYVSEAYGIRAYKLEEFLEGKDKKQLEAIIAVGEPAAKEKLYYRLLEKEIHICTLIHPNVYIDPSVRIGRGCIVYPGANIGYSVEVFEDVTLGPQVVLGHGCRIGAHSFIGSNCNISGETIVGKRNYVGFLSGIRDHTSVGDDVIISAGSVVFHDLPDNVIAVGNPARVSKHNTEKIVFKNRAKWEKKE